MLDLWGTFWGPSFLIKKAYKKYGQEQVDYVLKKELQFHLDEISLEQIESSIEQLKEEEKI